MKANQIQPVRLRDGDDALPRSHVRRRMAGQRKHAAFQRATKKCFASVHRELRAERRNFAETKSCLARRVAEFCGEAMDCRMKFIPVRRVLAQRNFAGECAAVCRPIRDDRLREFSVHIKKHSRFAVRAGRVADGSRHRRRMRRDVRIDLQIFDPHARRHVQRKVADEAVPVALRVVADAGRIFADVHDAAIVHADRQRVPARRELAEIIFVRRAKGIVRAEIFSVQPNLRLPVRTFEREDDALIFPVQRNFHRALIPRDTGEILFRCEPEGQFYISGLTILFEFRRGEIRGVADAARPDGVRRHGVADALFRQRAGQMEAAGKFFSRPIFGDARVGAVELKAPVAVQRQRVVGGQRAREQAAENHGGQDKDAFHWQS